MEKLDGNLSRQEKEIALLTASHQEEIAKRRNAQFIIICICGITIVALLSACTYIVILRHRRRIREEEIKLQQLKAENETQTKNLMERIEQLDSSKKLTNSVLQSLRTNIHDLETQKSTLENAVTHLEDNIRLLEKEIDSKDHSTALIEQKAEEYAVLIKNLKTQLKSSDTIIARLREQSREDFRLLHQGNAAFCNEMPKGLSSPEAIKLYEKQRDMRIKQYSDPTMTKSLETQINDLFDNMLHELTEAISLSETDIRALIYDICGFNYKAIALLLNVTPSAAAARRSRIKEKIINPDRGIPAKYITYLKL